MNAKQGNLFHQKSNPSIQIHKPTDLFVDETHRIIEHFGKELEQRKSVTPNQFLLDWGSCLVAMPPFKTDPANLEEVIELYTKCGWTITTYSREYLIFKSNLPNRREV